MLKQYWTRTSMRSSFQAGRGGRLRRQRIMLRVVFFTLTAWYGTTQKGGISSSLAMASSPTSLTIGDVMLSTGLNNLGNTCYMNAQLQCAFHIPLVRQIVMAAPPAMGGISDPNEDTQSPAHERQSSTSTTPTPAALAVKELFEAMDKAAVDRSPAYSPRSFCTRLGIPPMVQQDSQEFWKLLLPAMGSERLSDLYKGTYVDYISALDGSGRERRRDELFLDLSVDVARSSTLLDSLRLGFGEPELLSVAEGNGWRPEKGSDKVDAHKGSALVANGLPCILQFHLKRFNYDWQTDTTTKLNNRFSFPRTLDLAPLCNGIVEEDESLVTYELQAIVVHMGEYGVGHYYSYVLPDIESDKWYRFNDEIVQEVSFDEVTADAFGGRVKLDEVSSSKGGGLLKQVRRFLSGSGRPGRGPYGWGGKTSNAYVLQYVRKVDIPLLYHPKEASS